MVNLTPRQIIGIGAAIVFAPSLIIGLVVGHFAGLFFGVFAGGAMFIVTVVVAQVVITKRLKEMKDTRDEDKHEPE